MLKKSATIKRRDDGNIFVAGKYFFNIFSDIFRNEVLLKYLFKFF